MYKLTLSREERKAFDFVGDRYATGSQIANVLFLLANNDDDELEYWDADDKDITFTIPERVAWEIKQWAAEEDYLWPLFAPDLKQKMQEFVDGIV